jgi:AhpD family alkylhydroperoxidase
MEKRIKFPEIEPQAIKAVYGLEEYLQTTSLSKNHKHLIKLRASQINGCAYCIEMHTKEMITAGEPIEKLTLLDAWRESSHFTREEKAILALTEEVTLIHRQGVSEKVYHDALDLLGKNYLAQLIMAIVTINAWNRVAVSTHWEFGK